MHCLLRLLPGNLRDRCAAFGPATLIAQLTVCARATLLNPCGARLLESLIRTGRSLNPRPQLAAVAILTGGYGANCVATDEKTLMIALGRAVPPRRMVTPIIISMIAYSTVVTPFSSRLTRSFKCSEMAAKSISIPLCWKRCSMQRWAPLLIGAWLSVGLPNEGVAYLTVLSISITAQLRSSRPRWPGCS
jgi:hypothetical protein